LRELHVNPRSRGFQVEKQPSPAADWCPGNLFLPSGLIGDAALDADEGTEKPPQPWDAIASFTPEVKTATLARAARMAFGSSGNMLQHFEVYGRTSVVKGRACRVATSAVSFSGVQLPMAQGGNFGEGVSFAILSSVAIRQAPSQNLGCAWVAVSAGLRRVLQS
jgi:hypothetical protein